MLKKRRLQTKKRENQEHSQHKEKGNERQKKNNNRKAKENESRIRHVDSATLIIGTFVPPLLALGRDGRALLLLLHLRRKKIR